MYRKTRLYFSKHDSFPYKIYGTNYLFYYYNFLPKGFLTIAL